MSRGSSIISVFIGIIFFALAPQGNFYWIYAGSFLITFLLLIFRTLRVTITQLIVPVDKMGRFAGFFVLFNSFAFLIGYLTVGHLAELIGIIPLFISSASIAIICIASIFVFSKAKQLEKMVSESSQETPVKSEFTASVKKSQKEESVKITVQK